MPNVLAPIDLTNLLADYEGKWVVLSADYKELLAFGDSLDDLGDKISQGIVMKVQETESTFIPTFS